MNKNNKDGNKVRIVTRQDVTQPALWTDGDGNDIGYENNDGDNTQDITNAYNNADIGEMLIYDHVRNLARDLRIPNLTAVTSVNRRSARGDIQEQLKGLRAMQRVNFLHWDQRRDHISAISIRKNSKGYLIASIADSLERDESQRRMVLRAIQEENRRVWHGRVKGRAERMKKKGYRQSAAYVPCFIQPEGREGGVQRGDIRNTCGYLSVAHLYAMNNGLNVKRAGERMYRELRRLQVNKPHNLVSVAGSVGVTINNLQSFGQRVKRMIDKMRKR
jgi:hypothetical protein